MSTSRFDPSGPFDVAVCDTVYTSPDDVDLLARIYWPIGDGAPTTNRPMLVDVHGGAWRYFDRKADTYFDRAIAACGAVVIAIDFRQAPDHRWPSAAADVHAAIRWAKVHAGELGGRPDGIGLVGGSSGGHLCLAAALRPDAAELSTTPIRIDPIEPIGRGGSVSLDGLAGVGVAPQHPRPDTVDARVAYALPLWPIAAPDWRYQYLLERLAVPIAERPPPGDSMFDPERLKRQHDNFFVDVATMAEASALRMVQVGDFDTLPPIWIAHPELDENVTIEMTTTFADAYRCAGGEAELVVFPGVGHSFANFGGDAADECIGHMREFISRQLAG